MEADDEESTAETALDGGGLVAGTDPPSGDVESTLGESAQQNQGDFELCPFPAPDSEPIPSSTDRERGTGRFAKGNAAAKKHGLFSTQIERVLVEMRNAFRLQSIDDDGGEEAMPIRRRATHANRALVQMQIEALASSLERFGQFDRRGRLRVAWLAQLQGLIGTATRLDAALGLERQPRQVGEDLHASLAAAERERQATARGER